MLPERAPNRSACTAATNREGSGNALTRQALVGVTAPGALCRVEGVRRHAEIVYEPLGFRSAGFVVRAAENRSRMHGCHDARSERRVDEFAAMLGYAERLPEQRLRRGGAQADYDARLHEGKLGVEPGAAGGDLDRVGFGVDPPLPPPAPI